MKKTRESKKRPIYTSDKDGNVHITFENYDKEVAVCEQIKKDADEQKKRSRYLFMYKTSFPTIHDMEQMDLEKNFSKYFVYLLFYYDNDIPDLKNSREYQASMKYLKNIFRDKVIFEDDDEDEQN